MVDSWQSNHLGVDDLLGSQAWLVDYDYLAAGQLWTLQNCADCVVVSWLVKGS